MGFGNTGLLSNMTIKDFLSVFIRVLANFPVTIHPFSDLSYTRLTDSGFKISAPGLGAKTLDPSRYETLGSLAHFSF